MPFDGSRFDPPPPDGPGRAERLLLWLIAVLAFVGLLLPISLDGLVDLVRYLSRQP